MSDIKEFPEARDLLKQYRQRAKKSLGQNFLVDSGVLSQLAAIANETQPEGVLEIGPGPGVLTQALLRRGLRVLAVEKDRYAAGFLKEKLPSQSFEIVEEDFLQYELPDEIRQWVCVGNLPYNISTEIFFRLIPNRSRFKRLVFMFQREVANRFVAKPGTKAYGVLSVVGGLYYRMSMRLTVPPGAFRPAPKVHSAVVSFDPRSGSLCVRDEHAFRALVKAAFNKRRKQIGNGLVGHRGLSKESLRAHLEAVGVEPSRRPETLTVEEFAKLTDQLLLSEE